MLCLVQHALAAHFSPKSIILYFIFKEDAEFCCWLFKGYFIQGRHNFINLNVLHSLSIFTRRWKLMAYVSGATLLAMYLVLPRSWWISLVCAFFTLVTTPVKKTATYELLSSHSSPQIFALLSQLMAYNNISPGLYARSALLRSSTILFHMGVVFLSQHLLLAEHKSCCLSLMSIGPSTQSSIRFQSIMPPLLQRGAWLSTRHT